MEVHFHHLTAMHNTICTYLYLIVYEILTIINASQSSSMEDIKYQDTN